MVVIIVSVKFMIRGGRMCYSGIVRIFFFSLEVLFGSSGRVFCFLLLKI